MVCTGACIRTLPSPCHTTHASQRKMQVKYNIFERGVEKDGTLQACRDMGITLVAHSLPSTGSAHRSAVQTCMRCCCLHVWPS